MKNLINSIAIFLLTASVVYSQGDDFKVKSTHFYTGEGSLSSGFGNTTFFGWKGYIAEVDMVDNMGQVLITKEVVEGIAVGPTWGFFENTMWIAPVLQLNLFNGHLETLNWVGWSFGDAQNNSTKLGLNFMFSYQQLTVKIGNPDGTNLAVYGAKQNYYKTNDDIVGLKLNMQFSKKLSGFWGWGYMDHSSKHLWTCGLSYNFE